MLKVDIKNISRTDQDNKIIVLRDSHFTIDPGKVYLILGKNGSGKSTLIKSLTNLLNKNIFDIDGSVIWNDENILTVNEDKLILIRKNEIRYVLQDLTNNFDPLKKIKYYFDTSGLRCWTKAWFNGRDKGEKSIEITRQQAIQFINHQIAMDDWLSRFYPKQMTAYHKAIEQARQQILGF